MCAVSILYGVVAIMVGVAEIALSVFVSGWWKLLNAMLAVVAIAAGVVAFVRPGGTFIALAAIFSFLLVFAGLLDVIRAIEAHDKVDVWWLQLISGLIELGLGIWAAGYWGRSATLLVAWVGAFALIRGVNDAVMAFRVRELQH